jgi:protein TonB
MMMFRLSVAVVTALSSAALPIASAGAAENKEARVTPIGIPPDWFRAYDYPPAARDARQSGKVAITLSVDATGKAIGCEVTSSSGFPLLDTGTCEIALRNARFKPARSASGEAVAGTYFIPGVTWTLTD